MPAINVRALAFVSATAVRDAILSLPDGDRQIVISRPSSGQKEIVAINQHIDGTIECECIDIPIP